MGRTEIVRREHDRRGLRYRQSAKITEAGGPRGYDAGKKIKPVLSDCRRDSVGKASLNDALRVFFIGLCAHWPCSYSGSSATRS